MKLKLTWLKTNPAVYGVGSWFDGLWKDYLYRKKCRFSFYFQLGFFSFIFTARRLQTAAVLNGGKPTQQPPPTTQAGQQQQQAPPPQVSHQLPPVGPTVSSSTAALQARQQTLRLQRLQVEHERLRLRQQEIIKSVSVRGSTEALTPCWRSRYPIVLRISPLLEHFYRATFDAKTSMLRQYQDSVKRTSCGFYS